MNAVFLGKVLTINEWRQSVLYVLVSGSLWWAAYINTRAATHFTFSIFALTTVFIYSLH